MVTPHLSSAVVSKLKEKRYCPKCGKGVWMTLEGWELWPWATHPCVKEMDMTPEEVTNIVATLEQENRQLRARNDRLEEVLARILEIIEDNK